MKENETQCLDDQLIADYLKRNLDEAALSAIEKHIAVCESCRVLIAELAHHSDLSWSCKVSPPADTQMTSIDRKLQSGTNVGRYVVLNYLGSGGMGVVYAAYDPELDRKIALKVTRAELIQQKDKVANVRFQREAQAMARLTSPNVVTVHDVKTIDDQLVIAMEYIQGKTLRDWLKADVRSWKDIRDVYLDAAQGLQSAPAPCSPCHPGRLPGFFPPDAGR